MIPVRRIRGVTPMPRRRSLLFVLKAAIALVLAGFHISRPTALAQEPDQANEKGKKYALLIGVQDYDVNELHNLSFAEADVTALAETLRRAGYDDNNIVLMTQTLGAKKARFLPEASHIRKELDLLLANLDPDDSVLIAFAGHGIQFQGDLDPYFCPMDARLTDRSTLVALKEVYSKLEKCGAGLKVLLVDACRNDPRTKNARARAEVDLETVSRPQVIPPPGGVGALFGCSSGEKAQENEELRHGVFFYFVNQGLQGEADLDHDNQISPEELSQYVKKRVKDFVRAKNGVSQLPESVGSTRGLTVLATVKSKPPETKVIAANKRVEGNWTGNLNVTPQIDLCITLDLKAGANESLSGTWASPDESLKSMRFDSLTFKNDTLVFSVKSVDAAYTGKLNKGGTEITGVWKQRGKALPLILCRYDPTSLVAPTIPKELEGSWEGKLAVNGGVELRLVLKIEKDNAGSLKASLDSPDQRTFGIPIGSMKLDGDELTFVSKRIGAKFVGKRNETGSAFEGVFMQGDFKFPLLLQKVNRPQ
jgi:uncharacterized caspase-like protein